MYAVVRNYSGQGASQLFSEIESRVAEVERERFQELTRIPGFVSYTLLRTVDGGISLTVCEDKAGADASVQAAAAFIRQNLTSQGNPPVVSEGDTILHIHS